MEKEKKRVLKELEDSNEEYEKRNKFPEWLRRNREKARKIFREYEEKGLPAGRFDMDFNLLDYRPDITKKHSRRRNLKALEEDMKIAVEKSGQSVEDEEKNRTGSKLQEDEDTTYLGFTEHGERLLERYPQGLIVENIEEAVQKYPWMEKLWSHIQPINLDKILKRFQEQDQ